MINFNNFSIRKKIISIFLLVSAVILIIGFGFVISNEIITSKKELVDKSMVEARFIGEYCVVYLSFNDSNGAEKILNSVESIPNIEVVGVYDDNNKLFAKFNRSDQEIFLPEPITEVFSQFHKDHLGIFHPIFFNKQFYGTIYLKVSTEALNKRLNNFAVLMILLIIVLVFLSFIVANKLQKNISRPIKDISALAVKVGEGDLTIEIYESTRSDEVGLLSNAFRIMVENLKKQINEISNGVAVLSSTVSDITATSSELAASSTENASSISETTTTIEELKQTAQVASEKAKEISESSKTNIQVANESEKTVEATSVGMSRIHEQMESIAESIIKLSEQSQSIGDIMNSINDLAEQSNLLAVNAAIEAAKAGEEGKGFSVVATEVKNLAEQSKQATHQVRGILTDIQKAISNVALATEEGNKVVETGLKQSAEAGSSIKTLGDVIEVAAQGTTHIAVSIQEQSVGIDQINDALRNISTSSTQNLESTKQLETASLELEELGNNLKKLMDQYKVE